MSLHISLRIRSDLMLSLLAKIGVPLQIKHLAQPDCDTAYHRATPLSLYFVTAACQNSHPCGETLLPFQDHAAIYFFTLAKILISIPRHRDQYSLIQSRLQLGAQRANDVCQWHRCHLILFQEGPPERLT